MLRNKNSSTNAYFFNLSFTIYSNYLITFHTRNTLVIVILFAWIVQSERRTNRSIWPHLGTSKNAFFRSTNRIARCIPWWERFRNGWRRNTKVTAVASYVRMRIVPGRARDSVARFDIVWSTRRVHCLRTVRIAWSDVSRFTNINICGTINGKDIYINLFLLFIGLLKHE